jgi:hypothetical protein
MSKLSARAWASVVAVALVTLPLAAGSPRPALPNDIGPPTALDLGVTELYNLRFAQAHAEFERWTSEHPEDALGPACRLTVYLFQELYRLRIPNSSLLPDTHKPVAGSEPPDPRLRAAFYGQLGRGTERAQRGLARNPNDERALLALSIIYATHADYVNLVERRSWASLTLFKRSNRYAQQLLKRNPNAHDACAASGLAEYLASSLPFYARWFVRFDSVKGDRQAAIEQLERAAAGGRYLRPYAKILLAGVYLRGERPGDGLRVLRELSSEFPENTTLVAEIKARSRIPR